MKWTRFVIGTLIYGLFAIALLTGLAAEARADGIAGVVTNSSTSAPVPSVTVTVYNSTGGFVNSMLTNGSGAYAFPGLATGSYLLRTQNASGLIDQVYNGITCLSCPTTTGTLIPVTLGGATVIINFALVPGAVISGTITNTATSAVVSGVSVLVYTLGGTNVANVLSNGSGVYTTTTGLPTGSYLVRTINSVGLIDEVYNDIPCLNCNVFSGTPIPVTAPATTVINFGLTPGGVMSGTVTNTATSAAVSGVTMNLYYSSGTFATNAFTNGSGIYTTTQGLPGGSYFVKTSNFAGLIDELYNDFQCLACSVTTGTPVVVTPGSTSIANFGLTPGGTVTGTVTNATTSAPVSGVNVVVYTSTGTSVGNAITNASGVYTIPTGLPTGSYQARTISSAGLIDEVYNDIPCTSCNVVGGTPIAVTAPSPTVANFALSPGGIISGTVVNSATSAPLNGVSVLIYNFAGTQVASASTNASGVYTVGTGLTSGTYFAKTTNSQGFIDKVYNDIACLGCLQTMGTPIFVTAPATTVVNFGLAPGGRISGTITNSATSAPVASVTVTVYTNTGIQVGTAGTNAAGSYTLGTGLPTGSYIARTSNSVGLIDQLYSGMACVACTVTAGTPIAVVAGSTTTINFSLAPGGLISGTITNTSTSAVIPNVIVQVYTSTGLFITAANANAAGVYTIPTGLPTGSYIARTFNSLGFIDELYNDIPCLNCSLTTGNLIAVTAGSTTTINFGLTPGGRISGTITNASTSAVLSGVTVNLYTSTGAFITNTTTNTSGVYTFGPGFQAGTYLARTANSQGFIDELYNDIACISCTIASGTPIGVSLGVTTTVDFALTPGGRVTGTVLAAPLGLPLPGVTVTIYSSTGQTIASGTTNTAGVYTSTGLPTGTYYERTSNGQGFIDQVFNAIPCLNCNVTTGTGIPVTLGSPSIANFTLTLGGRLNGSVTNSSTGAVVSSATVSVYNTSGSLMGSTSTATNGFFSSVGLPAGTYYARTFNQQGLIDELYNDIPCIACSVTTGAPLSVVAGAYTPITFGLGPGGTISGTVVNATTGAPIIGATVTVYNSAGTSISSTLTNASGVYTIPTGLTTGMYFERTSANGQGLMDDLYENIPCVPCPVITGTPISVTTGVTHGGINFSLVPAFPIVSRADFNGDGFADILFRQNTTGAITIYLMNGGTIVGGGGVGVVDPVWQIQGTGDYNGDGKSDLLFRNTSTGAITIYYMSGNTIIGSGAIGPIDLNYQIVGSGDFNGDGKSDILWRHTSLGTIAVWLMDGATIIGGGGVGVADPTYRIVGSGDYNGDGRADILFRHSSGSLAFWFMNGSSTIGGAAIGVIDRTWEIIGSGDYNGDGKSDILWRNGNGALATWMMDGGTILAGGAAGPTDLSYQVVASGDYNGDHVSDVLWRQASTGQVVMWFISAGSPFAGGLVTTVSDTSWFIVVAR